MHTNRFNIRFPPLPPTSPEVEILSPPPAPPAPPLILIPDDADAETAPPPDSTAYYLEDGSDFSDWMDN